jgi:hypothetical protein
MVLYSSLACLVCLEVLRLLQLELSISLVMVRVRRWKKSSFPDTESSPYRRQNTVNHPNHQLSFAIHRFSCRASHGIAYQLNSRI